MFIFYNNSYISKSGFKSLAEEIFLVCLTELLVVIERLAKDAELAIKSGLAYDL